MPMDYAAVQRSRRTYLGAPEATAAGLTTVVGIKPAYRVKDMPELHAGYLEPSSVFFAGRRADPVLYVNPEAILLSRPAVNARGEDDGFKLRREQLAGDQYRFAISPVDPVVSRALYEPDRLTVGMMPIDHIEVYEPEQEYVSRREPAASDQ